MGLAAETQQKIPDQSIRDLSQAAMEGHRRSGRVQNAEGRKNNKALPPSTKKEDRQREKAQCEKTAWKTERRHEKNA